jgi:hypothetical protein
MPVETPVLGYGSKLELITGGPTRIARVKTIDGPEEDSSDVDVSSLDSVNSRKDYIPGMIDPSTLELEMWFTKTTFALLKSIMRTIKTWKYTLTDGSVFDFDGYVKTHGPGMELEDGITAACTIKITGDVAFTPAA